MLIPGLCSFWQYPRGQLAQISPYTVVLPLDRVHVLWGGCMAEKIAGTRKQGAVSIIP